MKKILILLAVTALCLPQKSFGWGKTGHDAVARIAEMNLKPKAKKTIEKYLDNHSIVYYSIWMDINKADPRYEILASCHTAYADPETFEYVWHERKPDADAVVMVEDCWARLKDHKNLDDSTVVVNLYALIHILGDMHCPGHVYYTDLTSKLNKYGVTFLGKETTYHSVWDSPLVENANRNWSYSEYATQLNRLDKKQAKEIVKGSPRDWFGENATDSRIIYEWGPEGAVLDRTFVNEAKPLMEKQLQKAGYRLAHILNDIFG